MIRILTNSPLGLSSVFSEWTKQHRSHWLSGRSIETIPDVVGAEQEMIEQQIEARLS
jgi:hypothetical protein